MNKECIVFSIKGSYEQTQKISNSINLPNCRVTFADVSLGNNLNLNDISTLIVAIVGAGGISTILTSYIQSKKSSIKVKISDEKITDIELDSSMSPKEIQELIEVVKKAASKDM